LKKVSSGMESEESGDNSERQDDKQQAEEQPGNEEFPCAIGVAAEAED